MLIAMFNLDDLDSKKYSRALSLITLTVSLLFVGICLLLPKSYTDLHDWPGYVVFIGALLSLVLIVCGGAELFWSFIPASRLGWAFYALGFILMLIAGFVFHSVLWLGISFFVIWLGLVMIRLWKLFH